MEVKVSEIHEQLIKSGNQELRIPGDINLLGEVCLASPAPLLSLPPALEISPDGEQLSWCEEVRVVMLPG